MNFLKIALPALLFLAAGVSCTACRSENNSSAAQNKTQEENIVSIGNTMLEAFKNNDSQLFAEQLSGELRQEFGKDAFETGRRQITSTAGNMTGHRCLGTLKGPVFTTCVWAVNFEKKAADKKIISQEMLFKLTAASLDNKVKVTSFGFML